MKITVKRLPKKKTSSYKPLGFLGWLTADANERERHSKRFADWRDRVFQRDKYTCQMCGKQGGHLNPHHIRQWARYPALRYKTANGITLCAKPCHEKTFGREEEMAPRFEAIIKRKQNSAKRRIKRLRQNDARKRKSVIK